MATYEAILVVALLSAPATTNKDAEEAGVWLAHMRPTTLAIASNEEIFDWRESYNFFLGDDIEICRPYWADATNTLRFRWAAFRDAPYLRSELDRLPSTKSISQIMTFSASFRQHMVERRYATQAHRDTIDEAICEANLRYKVWDAMRDARCEYYYNHARRKALKLLLDLIGPEAFYSGDWPDPVPMWALAEAR